MAKNAEGSNAPVKSVAVETDMKAPAPRDNAVVSHALPPEKPEAIRTRTKVILAFWVVIVIFGLPIWWETTSVYRASLPLDEMIGWAEGKACKPEFPLEIVVRTPSVSMAEAQTLLRTTQHALDDLNEFPVHHLRLKLADHVRTTETNKLDIDIESEDVSNAALVLNLIASDVTSPSSQLHSDSARLDILYPPSQLSSVSSTTSPLITFIAGEIQNLFIEEKATIAYILGQSNPALTSLYPDGGQLTDRVSRRVGRSLKHADTYHLSFSLFTPGSQPSSWAIEDAIQEYMAPLLDTLSLISNFSIDTQVQLYASFSPTSPHPEYDDQSHQWTLKEEDLSSFVNAAEWPLSPSIGSGPTINFVLYVPAATQSPLVVKDSFATSWIVPQWGGVAIVNPPLTTAAAGAAAAAAAGSEDGSNPPHLPKESLKPALLTFSHQLLTLLGTPATPSSLPLRLQTSVRTRAATLMLSASSTMGSLARLTQSLSSIPIPLNVASSVQTTLTHLTSTCQLLREGKFAAALASARIAHNEAEKSFFEKSMVGQMYFPDEHKVAVYLPLLGPIGVPLLMGLLKEVKNLVVEFKRRRSSS